ncbi:uncharacterized protein METZ01_LOCUS160593, partial [marine metagenome]
MALQLVNEPATGLEAIGSMGRANVDAYDWLTR